MGECFSQKYINLKTYNIDSLLVILPDQVREERVNSLNCLTVSLSFVDYDQSKQYADEAMNLAKELDYKEGIAAAFRNYGQIYVYQGNYPQALSNYLEALSIYDKLGEKNTAGWVCYEIAKAHYFANNYGKTIEYGNIALNIFRERTDDGNTVGNLRDSIAIYGGLAETYAVIGMFDKSLELDLKVLDIMKKNNFKNIELMIATFHAGAQYYALGEPDSAKDCFYKALAYPDESLNMKTLKYRNNITLGMLYYELREIDSAIYYMKTAFEFYEEKGFLFWALVTSLELGYNYYINDELNSAEKYLQKSEKIFNEMLIRNSWFRHDSLRHIANYGLELYTPIPPVRLKEFVWSNGKAMYELLYQLNDAKKRIGEAHIYFVNYSNAKDTLHKIQRNRETVELQTKYESERKDHQIEALSLEIELKASRLKQNSYLLYGTGGLFIIIILFGYILFRQNRIKTNQQMILLQQKLFRSQMNPHFIFNSLASIQNFVVRQDSKKASVYLSIFSELVRSILDNSTQENIPFEKEVSTIENYLELQKIRFPDKFDFSIVTDEKIDPENMLIPPMLAQPFIENSIEHGFKHKKAKGNLRIRFVLKNHMIVFEIEDDGIGRQKAQEIGYKLNKDHRSMSTDITRERLMVLNKKLNQKISFIISDLKNDQNEPTGTKVVFDIPYKYS